MLKFRNPGTDYNTHINIIKRLFQIVGEHSFTLDDMAIAIAQGRLMTARGYSGDEAIRLSATEQDSMNPTKMNVKMYAEVFRMMGWIAPFHQNSSYPMIFTYLGIHIALSTGDCHRLYEESVLGINIPNHFDGNMRYSEKSRFFKCALRTLIDLGGVMYKHELCLGPMCIDDENEEAYQNMLARIRSIRGDETRLKTAFSELASSLNMTTQSVDNQTRTPIGLMRNCGWIETRIRNRTLYGKSKECIRITDYGRDAYEKLVERVDLRLEQFNTYTLREQDALIRIGFYSMLSRAGYDISPVNEAISQDIETCSNILQGKELLFSPSATLNRSLVENSLGIHLGEDNETNEAIPFDPVSTERTPTTVNTWFLNIPEEAREEYLTTNYDEAFIEEVTSLIEQRQSKTAILNYLMDKYISSNQTVFYPLVETLFKVAGFNCVLSRAGDNGSRWDAIIIDNHRSIPIEIKSPREELYIPIKAIQQALENKIVLLSRGTYPTVPDVTTLVVGYYLPAERADVNGLINDIKRTYGYKIGVIDIKSLFTIAISIIADGNGFDKNQLFEMEGFIDVHF